jgi:hypothetical protein
MLDEIACVDNSLRGISLYEFDGPLLQSQVLAINDSIDKGHLFFVLSVC